MPPWSLERKTAQEKKGKFYFTGIPCKYGHIANRRVSDRRCVVCSNIKSAEWRKRKIAEDPEFKKKIAAWKRAEQKKHPEKYKAAMDRFKAKQTPLYFVEARAKRYGINLDGLYARYMANAQRCWICNKVGSLKGKDHLCIDHNHKTGQVRGLLCPQCNKTLGNWGENIEIMRRAIDYLEAFDNLPKG